MLETTFELVQKPFAQAILFILMTILSVLIIGPKNTDNTWSIAGIVFFGFMVVNSILIFYAPSGWKYLFYSLGFSVLYMVAAYMVVHAMIKLLKIQGSDESAMVFIIIMYHPLLLLLMLFLKWAYFKIF